jgi:DNA-binding Xre family transcriptional regulator
MIWSLLNSDEEVRAYTDSHREGRSGSMNWSPFQTLFRLIGESLFTYTGNDVHHQRVAYTQEFNSGKANAVAFETIAKISCAHIDALTSSTTPTEIDDIKYAMDNFALVLWGEHLYGNPNHHLDSQVLPVSNRIVELCGSPWPAIRYSLLALTRLVTPGKPTQGEASLRCQVTDIVDRNFKVLERNERDHPNAEPKTMRRISMQTGGSKTGPFSQFAVEFAHLNIFGPPPPRFLPSNSLS